MQYSIILCNCQFDKAHKKITASAKVLREFIFGKKQEKQGYGTVDVITPISIIRDASMLIGGKNTMSGAQEERKLQKIPCWN